MEGIKARLRGWDLLMSSNIKLVSGKGGSSTGNFNAVAIRETRLEYDENSSEGEDRWSCMASGDGVGILVGNSSEESESVSNSDLDGGDEE